jgi:hypothetical protein
MRRHSPESVDEALSGFAKQLDSIRHEIKALAGLRADVAAHSRALALLARTATQHDDTDEGVPPALSRRETSSAEAGPGDVPAPAWLTVADPAVAVAWLCELSVWVPAVWQQYLQTATPGCWPWHPAVVAELLVVRQQWAGATVHGVGPDPLAAWHDRWRPDAAVRVHRAMGGCERAYGAHKDREGKEYAYDLACLDEVAHWWATTHGSDPAWPVPGLKLEARR